MLALDMANFLLGSTMVNFDAAAVSCASVSVDDCPDIATAVGAVWSIDVKDEELASEAADVRMTDDR